MLGKAQAGKTSIAATLTGTGEDGVGFGFQRTTREPRLYPWPPPPEPPVLHFLDTPGIGADDGDAEAEARRAMAQSEDQAHVVLLVVRVEDQNLDGLIRALVEIRRRHPDWPLVVAQTRLHDLYVDGMGHPSPYPFDGTPADFALPGIPQRLAQAIAAQRNRLSGLPGEAPTFVPVDLTRPASHFEPHDYGAEALLDAIGRSQPETVDTLRGMRDPLDGARLRVILPWALVAGAAEAPPVPLVGFIGATTAQGMMLRAIAARCDVPWGVGIAWRFLAVLGPGVLASAGLSAGMRQLVKLAPGPGSVASAAAAFAVTWAAGEAAMGTHPV
ncbi:MAG: GTPase, partial [Rhodospirillales bacterium]